MPAADDTNRQDARRPTAPRAGPATPSGQRPAATNPAATNPAATNPAGTKPAATKPAAARLSGKVTSKLQVTIPKALATQLGIKPGDRLEWEMLGRALQMVPIRAGRRLRDQERSTRWAQMVERGLARRGAACGAGPQATQGRGWTRADLYDRPPREPR
jgi:AbrB family looped-hinge helix DNA binding protein